LCISSSFLLVLRYKDQQEKQEELLLLLLLHAAASSPSCLTKGRGLDQGGRGGLSLSLYMYNHRGSRLGSSAEHFLFICYSKRQETAEQQAMASITTRSVGSCSHVPPTCRVYRSTSVKSETGNYYINDSHSPSSSCKQATKCDHSNQTDGC
jgi:hypothetical protein